MPNARIEAHRLACQAVLEALYLAFLDTPGNPSVSVSTLAEHAGCDVAAVLADLKETSLVKQASPGSVSITASGRAHFNATEGSHP
ncbi:hypothetical protein [Paraburkholderia sp.]|uniref:hypothetical protein n=1 Tax=Paraburkholderia sp. TaxID=1926495 RepID=UPI003D6F63A8